MNKLKWSDFEWFKKNSKVFVDDYYFKCSEKAGLDQKIIFPIKKHGKYLTYSLAKKYTDFHLSNEDKTIPKKPIFDIRYNRIKNLIKKQMRIKKLTWFIPYSSRHTKKWILVDPYSRKFQLQVHKMSGLNIMPHHLLKLKIKSMRNNHTKILLAYAPFGNFVGIAKCNHRKGGFDFIPIHILEEIQQKSVNLEQVMNFLREEGLEENKRLQKFWYNWNKIIKFFNRFHIDKFI